MSVAWPWVMLCELHMVGFLTPNARFMPLNSMTIFSNQWSAFLHPGSLHTSPLLRFYSDVLLEVEQRANASRKRVLDAIISGRLRKHQPSCALGWLLKGDYYSASPKESLLAFKVFGWFVLLRAL